MTVIGLTGSLGSGKTTVMNFFAECGADVIDSDQIAHDLLKEGSCARKVAKSFPKAVCDDGIDRAVLAEIVFNHPRKLKLLESILHPVVRREIQKRLAVLTAKKRTAKMVIVDVPLLFEAGFEDLFDVIVVVKTNQALQVKRLMKRRGMKRKDIMSRIGQQMPQREKVMRADFIIDNRDTKARTRTQVKQIWDGLVSV